MTALTDLLDSLTGGEGDLGAALGARLGPANDPSAVSAAANSGLAAILGGLAGNASKSGGAGALLEAIQKDHDGSVLDDVAGALDSDDRRADGAKILGHVFGDNKNSVQAKVADQSGLDLGMVTKLLPMLAPIVMGYLGKRAQGDQLDADGLSGLLQGESEGLDLGDLAGLLGGGGGGNGADNLMDGVLSKVRDVIGNVDRSRLDQLRTKLPTRN